MSGHASRQATVTAKLYALFDGRGEAVLGEVGIQLDEETVVGCDAAVVRRQLAEEHRLLVPADLLLVVEVAETTLDRDTGLKRRKYAVAGIEHYWVIDGARNVVHVYGEPVAGDYASIATVRFGEPLGVPGTGASIVL